MMADLDKIKRNIQRMVDQNAPEGDVDAYVASEGVTPQQLRSHKPSNEFAMKAAAMTPKQLEFARATNRDGFGEYLRAEAKKAKPGETREQTETRLYGSKMAGPSKSESFARGGLDALAWGFGDEIAAGIEASTGGRDYSTALDRQRESANIAYSENPKSYISGQVAGAVVPSIATLGGSSGGSLGGTALRTGGMSAGQGAVYGFGSGEGGAEERLKNAGKNALLSGAFGAASPFIGKAVGAGWRFVSDKLAASGIPSAAHAHLLDMLAKAGLTPQQAAQKLDDLGSDAMLADLTQIEAAGTARASTDAGEMMGNRLATRRGGAGARVGSDLDAAMGPAVDPFTVQQSTKAAKSLIGPEYDTAIANAPQLPKTLDGLLSQSLTSPSVGLSMTNRKVMGGIMSEIDDALLADNPQETASRLLDIRQTLDKQIVYDARDFAALSSADKAAQGTLKQARGVVDDVLKNRIPGVREADAKFSPIAKLQDAYDFGRKELLRGGSGTVTTAELGARLSKGTPKENSMVAQGVRTEIDRSLSNARQNPSTTVDRLTSRDWNNDKLSVLLGKQKAEKLSKAVERESTFTETSNLIEPSRGSRTAVLNAAQNRWNSSGNGGLLGDMATAYAGGSIAGGPITGATAAAALGARRLISSFTKTGKANEKIIREVADGLTKTGADAKRVTQGLLDLAMSKQSNAIKAQKVNQVITGLLANAGRVEKVNEPFGLSLLGAAQVISP